MIKISTFPNGTIAEISSGLYKKNGQEWVRLDNPQSPVHITSMSLDYVDGLQDHGYVFIVGIPYPIAISMAEQLDRDRNPEEVILGVASEIAELQAGYEEHEADIDAIKEAEAQAELEAQADKYRYHPSEVEAQKAPSREAIRATLKEMMNQETGTKEVILSRFDIHIDSNHRWETDKIMEIAAYPVFQNEQGNIETDTMTALAVVHVPAGEHCIDTWVDTSQNDKTEILDGLPAFVRKAYYSLQLIASGVQSSGVAGE